MLRKARSCIIFGLEKPGLAFVEVLLLWLAIATTMILFWQRSMIAGVLFVPYLAWVSFASVFHRSGSFNFLGLPVQPAVRKIYAMKGDR